jgi:hypothetical protein
MPAWRFHAEVVNARRKYNASLRKPGATAFDTKRSSK